MTPPTANILLAVQVPVAAAMTGIIWFVQRVTYPGFLGVAPADFAAFHAHYIKALAPIVAPLMIAELGLALVTVWLFRSSPLRRWVAAAAAIAGALWLITFLVQVPLHDQLARGWSKEAIAQLIDTNWIRTALWSLRLALLLVIVTRLPLTAGLPATLRNAL